MVPITLALVGVLVILILSYRQTIKAYPSAGGAYIVTKDNLGLCPAQVAGVALLTDYILTVAVSVSAGVAALYSAFHRPLRSYRVPIALGFIAVIVLREPARRQGVGPHLRRPDLPLHRSTMFVMIVTGWCAARGGDLPVLGQAVEGTWRSASRHRAPPRRQRPRAATPSPPVARP